MTEDNLPTQHTSEDDTVQRISNMSLIEIGEKLFHWRDYAAIPALMILLLFANPSARTATVGTILIILGAVSRIYTVSFLGEDSKDNVGSDYLVTTGPYALVRNPLYISNMIIAVGVITYSGVIILGIIFFAVFAFQYHCITKYEENTLLGKFGEEYQRYMDRVPAWVPLKAPIADDFPVPPSLSAAFRAEKKALAAIGVILFLLMLAAR